MLIMVILPAFPLLKYSTTNCSSVEDNIVLNITHLHITTLLTTEYKYAPPLNNPH